MSNSTELIDEINVAWSNWMKGKPERIAQVRKDVLSDPKVPEEIKTKILTGDIYVDDGCLYGTDADGQPCIYALNGYKIEFLYEISMPNKRL